MNALGSVSNVGIPYGGFSVIGLGAVGSGNRQRMHIRVSSMC